MPDVTFISPVANYHLHLLDAVQATVAQQTVAASHVLVIDRAGKGAAKERVC